MLPQVRSAESRSQFAHRLEEQPKRLIETACSRLCVRIIECEDGNFQRLNVIGIVSLEQVESCYLFKSNCEMRGPVPLYITPHSYIWQGKLYTSLVPKLSGKSEHVVESSRNLILQRENSRDATKTLSARMRNAGFPVNIPMKRRTERLANGNNI